MELSALAVRVVYAEPLCFGVSALQGRGETLLLHLEWQQRQCAITTRNNSTGGAPNPGPAAQHAPASSSSGWAGHDEASLPGAQQLQGMLFDGLRCVAQYSWPLPLSQQEGGILTAAAQLPNMVHPCVLELVLYVDAANAATPAAEQQHCHHRLQGLQTTETAAAAGVCSAAVCSHCPPWPGAL